MVFYVLFVFVLCVVPNVVCISGLSFCVLCPMLSVSLDCRSVCCAQCCLCHYVVVLCFEFNVVLSVSLDCRSVF